MTSETPRTRHGYHPPRPKTTRPCVVCGNPATGRADIEFCSPACRAKRLRERRGAAPRKAAKA